MADSPPVLVIEKEKNDFTLLSKCLSGPGMTYTLTSLDKPTKAAASIKAMDPALVFIAQELGKKNAVQLITELRSKAVKHPIIVLAREEDVYLAAEVGRAGADGYLLKRDLKPTLLQKTVSRVLKQARERNKPGTDRAKTLKQMASLTPREHEVLEQIAQGLTNKQIAAKMNRSIETIKVHRAHIMSKMSAKTTAELVRQVTIATCCD